MTLRRLFCIALLIVPCGAVAQPPAALGGLWGAERTFGPVARGLLTIDGRGTPWIATIAGFTVAVAHAGARVDFALPSGQGSFNGHLSADGARVDAIWTQPKTVLSGDEYASPVVLHQTQQRVWRGDLLPLIDRMSLYLVIAPTADGSLRAYIRNPEANFGIGRSFAVALDGAKVTLTNGNDATEVLSGSYDAASESLALELPGFGTFNFTKRNRDTAVGFYPRTPDRPYTYRAPIAQPDGWRTTTLARAGIDPGRIGSLMQREIDAPATGSTAPYVQSILIARHGRLAVEEYFYGFTAERAHDLRSASKSITTTLVGIALDRGAPFSVRSPVLGLYPQYPNDLSSDDRKRRMTVEDLMDMTSGLACNDNDDASPGNEDRMYAQTSQTDYYRYALDVPMAAEPGNGVAVYCTIGINLLGGIVARETGMSLVDFFARYFAEPLQIAEYHVNLTPKGVAYMGGGLYLRPRDALKLAQLYLSHGVWNGRRVVSARWTDAATKAHSAFPATQFTAGHEYGYGWHLFTVRSGGRSYREYMAQGNGGQLIVALPALDAAITITAGNYNNFPTWRKFFEELIPQYIIPALNDRGS